MSYVIANGSGEYWCDINECWTVRQAATVYGTLDDCPSVVDGKESMLDELPERILYFGEDDDEYSSASTEPA